MRKDAKPGLIRVLLIEDNPLDVCLVQEALSEVREAHFELTVSPCLGDALDRLEQEDFDAILLDLGLPDSEGLDGIDAIIDRTSVTPVVIMTGQPDDKLALAAIQRGADDYLIKGEIPPHSLVRILRYAAERRNMVAELQKTARNLQAVKSDLTRLIDQNADAIVIADRSDVIRFANPAAEKLFGRKMEDLLGLQFGYPLISGETPELEIKRLEGDIVYAEMRSGDLKWGGEEVLLASLRDITERKRLENQLVHAQKMESIGQLAAGIAHEINTPIQYVGDNLRFLQEAFGDLMEAPAAYESVLRESCGESPRPEAVARLRELSAELDLEYLSAEIPQAIGQALEGVEQVARIVRAMKQFSHPDTPEKTATDLNTAIESTVTVARNEWKYVADMVLELDPELPLVPCLPGDFNQAILNIIVNAAHAIGERLGDMPPCKGRITVTTRAAGSWVEIHIGDTGGGIPEQLHSRVFDPFFTTKEVGKGTGQGLAIAYSVIVEKHGGTITFETKQGVGTTFIIRLPLRKLKEEK